MKAPPIRHPKPSHDDALITGRRAGNERQCRTARHRSWVTKVTRGISFSSLSCFSLLVSHRSQGPGQPSRFPSTAVPRVRPRAWQCWGGGRAPGSISPGQSAPRQPAAGTAGSARAWLRARALRLHPGLFPAQVPRDERVETAAALGWRAGTSPSPPCRRAQVGTPPPFVTLSW